jgi:hypothetical protein
MHLDFSLRAHCGIQRFCVVSDIVRHEAARLGHALKRAISSWQLAICQRENNTLPLITGITGICTDSTNLFCAFGAVRESEPFKRQLRRAIPPCNSVSQARCALCHSAALAGHRKITSYGGHDDFKGKKQTTP